ncbi:hypothetical protein U27_05383 [Candidatus Vecturithrix granuli]|uniref:Uncharacterized protein n=1 Tax=Vecturithrix granuli TaxID=1499967 RepID=A0A081C1F4_VECG1|nr:hypothetical protein U27_05383 [Candidatus Vecturithrix granuli]
MTAERLFLEHISKLKKRALFQTTQQGILVAFILFFLTSALTTGLEKTGTLTIQDPSVFYAIVLGIALVAALSYTLLTKPRFQDLLIDIDRRLHLRDRLSTAYEYYTREKSSQFTDLLIEDASRKLNGISIKDLLPSRFSRIYLLLLFLLLLNLGLFLLNYFSSRLYRTESNRETTEKIEKLMKDYAAQKAQDAQQPREAQRKLARQMDELARQLQDQAMNRQELSNAVNQMLKEVQSEQSRLAKDLESQLDEQEIENFQELSTQKTPSFQQLSQEDLQKLQQFLKNMLKNQMPLALDQTLSDLNALQNLEDLLSQMLDELGEESPDSSEGSDAAAQQEEDSQNQDGSANDGETAQGRNGNQAGSEAQQSEEAANQTGSGQEQQEGQGVSAREEGNISDDSEQGHSISAGRGKADGSQYAPYQMEGAPGPTLEDHTVPSKKSEYNIHIRSVTSIGNATVPEEEITREYQREVESILQKEEIPANYREFIKNYFISIGLTQAQ